MRRLNKNENGVSEIIGIALAIVIVTGCMGILAPVMYNAVNSQKEMIQAQINSMLKFTDYLNSLGFGNKTIYKNTTIYVNQTTIKTIYPESPEIELQLNKTTGEWHFFVYDEETMQWFEYVEQLLFPPTEE